MAKSLPDLLLPFHFLLACTFQQPHQIVIQANFFDKAGKFIQETSHSLTARFEKIQQRLDKTATHDIEPL